MKDLIGVYGASGFGREVAPLVRLAKGSQRIVFIDDLPVTGTQKVRKCAIFAPGVDPRTHAKCHDLRSRKVRPGKTPA